MDYYSLVAKSRSALQQTLRGLLHVRGWKQNQFAKAMGHSGAWASNLLNGKRGTTLDALDELAEQLHLPAWQLLVPRTKEQSVRLWTRQEKHTSDLLRHADRGKYSSATTGKPLVQEDPTHDAPDARALDQYGTFKVIRALPHPAVV